MEKIKFETITEFNNFLPHITKAEEKQLFIDSGEKIEEYKLIRINGKNINVLSKNYSLLQHENLFSEINNQLINLGISANVMLRFKENGARLSVYYTFSDKFLKDDANGIKLGLKVTNSFDGSTSIRFEAFALRLVCSNGMTIKDVLGRERLTHVGLDKKDLKELIKIKLTNIINVSNIIQKYIDEAIQDSIEWSLLKEILNKWAEKKLIAYKHFEKILEKIGISMIIIKNKENNKTEFRFVNENPNRTITRWDIYNAFTNYLSHETNLKYGLVDYLEELSSKILMVRNLQTI